MTAPPDDREYTDADAPDAPPARSSKKRRARRKSNGAGLREATADDEPKDVKDAPPHDADQRPFVHWRTDRLPHLIEIAADHARDDADVFQRDGRLVRVVRVAESEADSFTRAGTPVVRDLPAAVLREVLVRAARWRKLDRRSMDWVAMLPPDAVVQAILERGSWTGVRPIAGVCEAPLWRPDGSILETPGFDAPTGYLFVPSGDFPSVRPCPTQQDARDALAELVEVWTDFPWRGEPDRYVPIALVLTLLARAALGATNIPGFILESNVRGAGKGKATNAAALIATGRAAAAGTYPSADAEELEKILGAAALGGTPVLAFDNVDGPFGGGPLERVLTCNGRTALRILGQSTRPELMWRGVIIATANNIEITGDTCRRVLVARIDHPLEVPEARPESDYQHHPLEDWVSEHRPRLVRAALTILRSWHCAGRPRMGCRTWGSFEHWAATIPPAIKYAGGEDVMACRVPDTADPAKVALRSILLDWPRLGDDGISVADAIDVLYPMSRLRGEAVADSYADLREAIEYFAPAQPGRQPSKHKLGNALRRFRERNIEGRMLVSEAGRHTRWRVELLASGDP